MGLNIKNERTHARVRELAARTGLSQTSAVEDAVERRLRELQTADDQRSDRIDSLLARIRAELTDADREALRRAERDLYVEAGLPR